MFTRTKYNYNVKLQASDGTIIDFPVGTYWSPEKEGAPEAIAATAKGMAFWQSGGSQKYAPLGVTQLV